MIRRITDSELPFELFKYREWGNPMHQKLIRNYQIYLPSPSSFNDPFDGSIPVRWDLMSFEDCVEKNYELLSLSLKNHDQKKVREYAEQLTHEKTFWHPDRLEKETSQKMKEWDKVIGLFSLSEDPLNILMWSHYSANHLGFVVGLDTTILSQEYDFDYIEPIVYQRDYPIISGTDDSSAQFHKKFFYKSILWRYEKEWRISKNHIENRKITMSPETFTRVILGCRMTEKHKREIIKWSKKKLGSSIRIDQTVMSEEKFGLEIRRVN